MPNRVPWAHAAHRSPFAGCRPALQFGYIFIGYSGLVSLPDAKYASPCEGEPTGLPLAGSRHHDLFAWLPSLHAAPVTRIARLLGWLVYATCMPPCLLTTCSVSASRYTLCAAPNAVAVEMTSAAAWGPTTGQATATSLSDAIFTLWTFTAKPIIGDGIDQPAVATALSPDARFYGLTPGTKVRKAESKAV